MLRISEIGRKLWLIRVRIMVSVIFSPVYPTQYGVIAQNDEQPIRLPNPRVELEQRTHSTNEIKLPCYNPTVVPFQKSSV